MIPNNLKTTQSCQRSYVDIWERDLEFDMDNLVLLKVSPHEGSDAVQKEGKALYPLYWCIHNIKISG